MRLAAIAATALLSGCAGVSFTQLNADLTTKTGAPKGAVYYMPKPYLLVTQLPYTALGGTAVSAQAPDPAPPPKKGGQAVDGEWPADYASDQAATGNQTARGGADEKPAAGGDAGLAAGSDQSFGGSGEGYLVKVIYLPDMSRPMSVSMRAGIGSANLKPTLQNGWMLTGFDASADSKTAEILTALAPLLTAYKTPGKAAGGADAKGGGAGPAAAGAIRPILRPGLYEIEYDARSGKLKGICARTFFTAQGTVPASGEGMCTQ